MERRRYPRIDLDEPAYVSAGGSVMGCTVRNISADGAAIEVANPAFVPSRFKLVMATDRSVRDCEVVWIRDNRIGISFPPQAVAKPSEDRDSSPQQTDAPATPAE